MGRALLFTLLASTVLATPIGLPAEHNYPVRAQANTFSVAASSAQYLCDVKSDNILNVGRDLGYVGQIGNTTIHTYGDTLDQNPGQFFMTSGSSAIGTADPCTVHDAALEGGNHPAQFIPVLSMFDESATNTSYGGTNVLGINDTDGVIFYLKNYRPNGVNKLVGAGVAGVTLVNGVPKATRIADYWWDTQAGEPNYGDITAYTHGEHIWALGHGGYKSLYPYLTRVHISQWQNLTAYEYYNAETNQWQTERLYNPSSKQSVQGFYGLGQGQMFYSNYYQKHMLIYMKSWPNGDGNYGVYAATSDAPHGPWSTDFQLFEVKPTSSSGLVYCSVANTQYDSTGKTVVVTVDNGPTTIQAYKVTFT